MRRWLVVGAVAVGIAVTTWSVDDGDRRANGRPLRLVERPDRETGPYPWPASGGSGGVQLLPPATEPPMAVPLSPGGDGRHTGD